MATEYLDESFCPVVLHPKIEEMVVLLISSHISVVILFNMLLFSGAGYHGKIGRIDLHKVQDFADQQEEQ